MARPYPPWPALDVRRAVGSRLALKRGPGWLWRLLGVVLVVESGLLIYGRSVSTTQHLHEAQLAFARADMDSLRSGCVEVEAAVDAAGPFLTLLQAGSVVPIARVQAWAQVPHMAVVGEQACRAFELASSSLLAGVSARPDTGAALLAGVQDQSPALAQAAAALNTALDQLQQVDPKVIRSEPRLVPVAALVDRGLAYLSEMRVVADVLPRLPRLGPRLLGGDRPRTFLLVGQNEDEARATGGFIGTLGQLTLDDGHVTASDVRSSYDWDNPSVPPLLPPQPLQKYRNFGAWELRDANWWVDFPSTSQQLLAIWDRQQGHADQIDGIIAMDVHGLGRLLDAVGGVEVPELGGYVDAGNVQARLDERRRSSEALQSATDYQRVKSETLGGLHRALLARLVHASARQLPPILLAIRRAAQEKHLLLWFRDPELENATAALDWDGRLSADANDLLGVVATSMSYGKVMPYIVRQRQYSRQADGSAVLTLTYANHYRPTLGAKWDPLIDGTWWDWHALKLQHEQGAWLGYVRVLAPPGSALLASDGWDDQPSTGVEGEVVVFGGPVLIKPGQSRTLSLTYSNPSRIDAPLRIFHQPGDPDP